MTDLCRCCHRPITPTGSAHREGHECPDSPSLAGERREIYCLQIGLEVRDDQLAAAKAANDRARVALVRVRDALDLAVGETGAEP